MTENNEAMLLKEALLYEEGHPRRTQHILKVYGLAKLFGEIEGLPENERIILNAAAILHDIPIKYCKLNYDGNACQENQQKEAPHLVKKFLLESGYNDSYIQPVLNLILNHHKYNCQREKLLQLLIEADLIINCYESTVNREKADALKEIFKTQLGRKMFDNILKNIKECNNDGKYKPD